MIYFEKLMLEPGIIRSKVYWFFIKRKFASVGDNFRIGTGSSVLGLDFISIGNNFSGGKDVKIHAWNKNGASPQIVIGNEVTFTDHSYISCANRVTIGNGVLLGENSFITDNFHGSSLKEELVISPSKRRITSKGEVIIDDNVWLGRNVCVMPNVHIGEGTIIGANSVVTHDIPSYSIAAGTPAKIISEIK